MEERYVSANFISQEDGEQELSLRPRTLREYVGQTNVKSSLEVYLEAARMRREPIDHMLLYGPPGLGKTCLAAITANEMGAQMRVTSGPAIEKPGDLASVLNNLNEGDVLFIDEIHRLSRTVEEILYPAMEDFALDIFIGKGPSARSIRINLPHFTLVGATTKAGALASPLRDRFGIQFRLETYSPQELAQIVTRSAGILNIPIDSEGAFEIARRSRGTPRIANRLLKRVRDFALVRGNGVIDLAAAKDGLSMLFVDELGLDHIDRLVLETMISKFAGKPVGLNTLSAATGEDAHTIEDVYEPYLLQIGFIMRTPSGRIPTHLAYAHLGISPPAVAEQAQQITIDEV